MTRTCQPLMFPVVKVCKNKIPANILTEFFNVQCIIYNSQLFASSSTRHNFQFTIRLLVGGLADILRLFAKQMGIYFAMSLSSTNIFSGYSKIPQSGAEEFFSIHNSQFTIHNSKFKIRLARCNSKFTIGLRINSSLLTLHSSLPHHSSFTSLLFLFTNTPLCFSYFKTKVLPVKIREF